MSICRKKLDEERGNPWICECPLCRAERGKGSIEENDSQDQSEDEKEGQEKEK